MQDVRVRRLSIRLPVSRATFTFSRTQGLPTHTLELTELLRTRTHAHTHCIITHSPSVRDVQLCCVRQALGGA